VLRTNSKYTNNRGSELTSQDAATSLVGAMEINNGGLLDQVAREPV
jgi:hypothetical protein